MIKFMRPQTANGKKNNILIRKSHSKDLTSKFKLSEYASSNTKSTSPVKKK